MTVKLILAFSGLFLIVSGFCIHMVWARQSTAQPQIDFGHFWKRRLHRLYPPYFVALLVSIAGLYVLHTWVLRGGPSFAAHFGYANTSQLALDAILLVFLAQNFNNAGQRIGNGPFWTLALEEQLYLLYFPLLWMRRRWSWTQTLGVVAAVTLTWRTVAAFAPDDLPLFFLGPSRWFEWVLGALAVEAYTRRVELPPWCSSAKVGVALLVFAFAVVNSEHLGAPRLAFIPVSDMAVGFALFVLVNAACAARWAESNKGLVTRFCAWVGTFSYSLYLTHQPVVVAAKHIGMRAGLGTVGILCLRLALPLAVGWLFYILIERRFLSASRRRVRTDSPVATVAPATRADAKLPSSA